jgi:hypothetical protein
VQPKTDGNLLKSLREYYSDVKTKRQLNLDVSAGFCQRSTLQKDFNAFLPPCKLGLAAELPLLQSSTSSSTELDNKRLIYLCYKYFFLSTCSDHMMC